MLKGDGIILRTVRESDLKTLFDYHCDLTTRGDYFPLNLSSEISYAKAFRDSGWWTDDGGTMVVTDLSDTIVGRISFYRTLSYIDEAELSYLLLDHKRAGKGIMTEALRVFTRYLLGESLARRWNRLRLGIHPENRASIRMAEKCGYKHEGTVREGWFTHGKYHDLEIYGILKRELFPG